MNDPTYKRKSFIEIGEIFFWTATINNWNHLLKEDVFKQVIIDSLNNLSERELIDVFAFVIMPNHIHLIWRTNKINGKETAQSSFLKFTAHQFKKLLQPDPKALSKYAVQASNKSYEFWQRDPLAIDLYTREVMLQKLHYIHINPLAPCNWFVGTRTRAAGGESCSLCRFTSQASLCSNTSGFIICYVAKTRLGNKAK